jgi:hypothetical protein
MAMAKSEINRRRQRRNGVGMAKAEVAMKAGSQWRGVMAAIGENGYQRRRKRRKSVISENGGGKRNGGVIICKLKSVISASISMAAVAKHQLIINNVEKRK